ncbi:MAG: hypothetical protein ABII82_00570 [Verrucomicrobiota bacterium]
MANSEKQTALPLDLAGDGLASAQPMSVRVTGGKSARALTRDQKKFSKLLREVETLRARQQRVTAAWETFLAAYLKRIHPEEQRQHDLRKALVHRLAAHLHAPKGLGPRQRDALTDIIERQLAAILDHEPDLADPELLELITHFRKRAEALAAADNRDPDADPQNDGDLPPFLADLIRDSGLDPAGFRAGMTPQEIEAELARQMEADGFDVEPDFDDAPPPPKRKGKTKAKTAPDPRVQAAQAEEARKRTIATIYKQLAKVLHPDLETDPALREQKHHLMQELTAAYKQGDLHTLLRLELAWIHREEGDLDRLTDEKLKVYIQLLHEQVADLRNEVFSIPHSPRFGAVARFASRFTGEPERVEDILRDFRPLTASMQATLAGLESPDARAELREIIKAHIAHQKAQSRMPDLRVFFD